MIIKHMSDETQLADVQSALDEVTSIWSEWVPAVTVPTQPQVAEEPKQTVEDVATPEPKAEVKDEKPKSWFAKILSQRNEARTDAEHKAEENRQLQEELSRAQQKILELSAKEVEEWEARAHDLEIVDAISKKNSIESDLQRSKKDEAKDFYKQVPEAVAIKDKLDDLMKQHPTLSPYQAAAMYAWMTGEPANVIDDQKEHKKENYDLLGSSSAWSSTKWNQNDFNTMSDQDMKEALRQQIISGDLAL